MKKLIYALFCALSFSQALYGTVPTGPAVNFNTSTIIKRVNSYGGAQNVTQSILFAGTALSNGTDTQRTFRSLFNTTQYTYDPRVVFGNYGIASGTNAQTGPGNSVTITAGIEYNGVTVPLTFNGQTSAVMPNGGEVVSDTAPMDLPANTVFYVRSCVTVTSGNKWPLNQQGGNGNVTYSNNGSDLSAGTGALANAAAGQNVYAPTTVLGSTYPLSSGSIYISGDSIAQGTGDAETAIFPNSYQPGFITRGLGWYTAGTAPYAWMQSATSGTTLAEKLNPSLAPSLNRKFSLNDYAIVEDGTNDFANNLVATQQANYVAYWTMFASRGINVYQTTLLPKTNSNDRWRTIGNQLQSSGGQTISGATNASPIAITLTGNHFLTTGETVNIAGCTGNTAANGTWVVTVTGGNTMTLNGSTGNGTYTTNSGFAATGEANRVFLNNWIRTVPAPLTGVIETANVVEANSSNVLTQNGGYWYVPSGATSSGTATSGTGSSLTDSTQSWTVNQWAGYICVFVSGTGSNHSVTITSNTATTISFGGIGVTPESTTVYAIGPWPTADGTHPSPLNHVLLSAPVAALAATLPRKSF
jgi:lysophospholipase L1-like esterase